MKQLSAFLLLVLIAFTATSQELPLTIENLEVKYKGETTKVENPIDRKIIEDQASDVLIHEVDGYKYMSRIEYFRSVNRVKMTIKNYILKPDGKKIYGKTKKYVQFIKVGIPGQFEKVMSEQIIIDKKTFQAITASYRYTIKYAYN